MVLHSCDGCRDRQVRIAELEARVAELERFQRESTYLRDESRIERDLRPLTGESQAMKAVRLAIQQAECIDCEACVPECPVEAIFHDANVPQMWSQFVQLNAERVATLKSVGGNITERQEPQLGAECRAKQSEPRA